jgi:hypothetical protein
MNQRHIYGGNKMDQSLATILTTLITALGTLGGAIIGVILTDRHAFKMETLKRRTQAIEEAYTLLEEIRRNARANIEADKPMLYGSAEQVSRVATLINLYLPGIKKSLEKSLNITHYKAKRGKLDTELKGLAEILDELFREEKSSSPDEQRRFLGNLRQLRYELEKLVG